MYGDILAAREHLRETKPCHHSSTMSDFLSLSSDAHHAKMLRNAAFRVRTAKVFMALPERQKEDVVNISLMKLLIWKLPKAYRHQYRAFDVCRNPPRHAEDHHRLQTPNRPDFETNSHGRQEHPLIEELRYDANWSYLLAGY